MSSKPISAMNTLEAFDFINWVTSSDEREWKQAVAQLTDDPPGYLWNNEPLYVVSRPLIVNVHRVPERTCIEHALVLAACSHPERLTVLVDFVTGHGRRDSLVNAVAAFAAMASALQKKHGSEHIRASFKAMLPLLAHMHESEKDEVRFRLDVYVPLNTQLFTQFWDQHVTGQQKAVLLRAARDQQCRSPVAKRKM